MIALESMAVAMPVVEGHPNRAGFRGVLTLVDVASKRAPSGSKGRRVILTREAAEAALPSLLGMALDYAPSYDRHDARRKVGVITSAELLGRNLEVGGYLYGKDFPDVVEVVGRAGGRSSTTNVNVPTSRAQNAREMGHPAPTLQSPLLANYARNGAPGFGDDLRLRLGEAVLRLRELTAGVGERELGMSFEITDSVVADLGSRVWILTKVTFTGAAILRRDRAAYEDTWIELSTS
jgi:hypothetical protein